MKKNNKLWNNENHSKVTHIVTEFTTGEDVALDTLLVKYDAIGSIAHATMLTKLNIITKDELAKIKKALIKIISLSEDGKFRVEPDDEDVHTKIENYLTAELGDSGKKIHTCRSRNDQILVDLRLYSKGKLLEIQENVLRLCKALTDFANRNDKMPMPGYTHLQKAMPSSVPLWALAYVESLLDDMISIKSAYTLNNQNPLGSAAGYGVPINIDRKITTELLGFEKIQNNVLYVQNSRGKIETAILSAMSQVMLDLGRMANDMILFSTEEFGFFEIPDDFCTGSSIMPKKRNPDVLELIRGRANRIFSYLYQTIGIVKDLPSGYNRDLQELKEPLLRGMMLVNSCLRMMSMIVKNLKANKENLTAAFIPRIFAADKALELVAKGIPFRDAYKEIEYNFLGLDNTTDPSESIKLRSHIGSTGRLGVEKIEHKIAAETEAIRAEAKFFHEKINALIK
ncbi:MAG: argininosuccinate lyase [Candidatus Aenigmarchaeota archaeon]|nr:argininosuccinate lyase [Candidatus Aenigmarchaeota archaeon]